MSYILLFVISTFFVYLCDLKIRKSKERHIFLLMTLSAFLLCIIAGIRADSVGTDVAWYVVPNFQEAIRSNSLLEFMSNLSTEPLYNVLVYFMSRLSHELGLLLFAIEALIVIPFYIVLYRNRKLIPMWMVHLTYCFFVYNYSLSIMRQCIAASFLLLANQLFMEKKNVKALIVGVIAVLFHASAIIILIVEIVLYSIEIIKKYRAIQIVLLICCVVLLVNLQDVLIVLTSMGIIKIEYVNRFNYFGSNNSTFSILYSLLMTLFAVMNLLLDKKNSRTKYYAVNLIALIGLMIATASYFYSIYLGRLLIYFLVFYAIELPLGLIRLKGNTRADRMLITLGFFLIVYYYWHVEFVKFNVHETFPYLVR